MKKCIVAGVLIVDKSGRKVLLVRHKKLGVWIYPGGHLEKGEDPLECAIRESKEETSADFNVTSTIDFKVDEKGAKSSPQPLVIMDEIVPYSSGPHQHFDIIYLGIASKPDFHRNDESTDCKWIERDEVSSLETFDNVKAIIRYGFEVFDNLSSSHIQS